MASNWCINPDIAPESGPDMAVKRLAHAVQTLELKIPVGCH